MNDNRIIYHGSQKVIERPVFGAGNVHNDYGLGFYCTESLELAREWACSAETDGYANEYALDMTDLSVLSLTGGEYNILNWLYILLENRTFKIAGDIAINAKEYIFKHFAIDYKGYDIIKGYRADDSYFSFASSFLNNTITLSQLEEAMSLGKLGEQIAVISEKAFSRLTFTGVFPAPKEMYYPKKLARDTVAREAFRKQRGRGAILNGTYILDIIRERWNNDDARLQRILLK